MNVIRVRSYLNEKYDGMFRHYTKCNAYNRLWLLYKELNMSIEAEYVPHPSYGDILLPYTKSKIVFIRNKLKMIEDNSLWSCYGQRFIEGGEKDYYFGRLVMLLLGHYGLSLGEIRDICHIEDPKGSLLSWVRHCIRKGWCCPKRVESTPVINSEFAPRPSLEVFLMETFDVKSDVACMFLNKQQVKSIVDESLSISARIFYDVEYLKKDPDDYDLDPDMWASIYRDAVAYISQKMMEAPTRRAGVNVYGWGGL